MKEKKRAVYTLILVSLVDIDRGCSALDCTAPNEGTPPSVSVPPT